MQDVPDGPETQNEGCERVIGLYAVLGFGLLAAGVGAVVMRLVDDARVEEAGKRERRARRILAEADRVLSAAAVEINYAVALKTPTEAYAVVKPRVRVRGLLEWAFNSPVGEVLPDWRPGEIAAIPEGVLVRPPLRPRPTRPARARKWLGVTPLRVTPEVMTRVLFAPGIGTRVKAAMR